MSKLLLSRLCVSSRLWRRRPIGDVARAMMRLGLTRLELACAPAAPQHFNPDGDNGLLFNTLAEAGVSPMILRVAGLTYQQKLRAMEEAGERGVAAVVDRAERLAYPDLLDRLRAYTWAAAGNNLQYIIENDYGTVCDTADAQLTLLRALKHPALAFGLAPPHALVEGRDPAEEVRALGTTLRLAHLWDASARAVKPRPLARFSAGPAEDQPPGQGEGRLNWIEYFRALGEVRFRGLFNLGWDGADAWDDDRIEQSIRDSIAFCVEVAAEVGWRQ